MESPRLIAGLTRIVRDVGVAEDLAQDALVAAFEQWPKSGVPDNPGAWLMAVARRRGVDAIRRAVTLQGKVELLGRELRDHETPMDEIELDPSSSPHPIASASQSSHKRWPFSGVIWVRHAGQETTMSPIAGCVMVMWKVEPK